MPGEQTDDTSITLIEDQYFRDFLNRKGPFESQADFPNRFQRVAAEMNRRLARQQGKFLAGGFARAEVAARDGRGRFTSGEVR